MNLQCLIVFILWVSASNSLNIDLTSINMDHDLHRLCWKQLDERTMDSIQCQSLGSQFIQKCPVYSIVSNGTKLFCTQNNDLLSIFQIKFVLENPEKEFKFLVNFSLPLAPRMPLIRKTITSTKVIFELNANFAGYQTTNCSQTLCELFIIYKEGNKTITEHQKLNSKDRHQYITKFNPETSFKSYYSCHLFDWNISSPFIADSGFIGAQEETTDLKPFIQYPFRRFIFAQWENPSNIPNWYYITIYKLVSKNKLICVKIFRAYWANAKPTKRTALPKLNSSCERTEIEDLGVYLGSAKIYVMLDMITPLEKNTVYKFLIEWKSPIDHIKENFIYFEPFKNEWVGIIKKEIEEYNPSKYTALKDIVPDILQNVVSNFSSNPVNFTTNVPFNETIILPTISEKAPIFVRTKTIKEIQENCKTNDECSSSTYPFFYALFKREIHGRGYSVDIAQVFKKERSSTALSQFNLEPNNNYSTFTVSWNVANTYTLINPSIYIIRIKQVSNGICEAQYTLGCSTCNKMYKETSLSNLKIKFSNSSCKQENVHGNYFKALTSHITYETKEIKRGVNYTAKVYFFNSDDKIHDAESEIRLIEVKVRYKKVMAYYIPVSIICSIVLLIVIIVLIKYYIMARTQDALSSKEDSNKYYSEDDF